jgi:hypothetical protein
MRRAILIGLLLSQGCVHGSSGFAPAGEPGRAASCDFGESCGSVTGGGGDGDVMLILAAGATVALLSNLVLSRLP